MTKNNDRVSLDKTCSNCIGYKDGWCRIHHHSTREINYGCETHLTPEAYEEKLKEMDKMFCRFSVDVERGVRCS